MVSSSAESTTNPFARWEAAQTTVAGQTAEAYCDGHNAAFAFFRKVPRSILYDNTRLAVARILGDSVRQRTRVFSELQSHYLFADRFGQPGKGKVGGQIG
jgi:transposase